MSQLFQIEFSHPRENNRESEQHYFDNLERFTKQAKFVYEKLKAGEVLTSLSASRDYMIVDLGARISELRRGGIMVQDDFVMDEKLNVTRFKRYFMIEKFDTVAVPGVFTRGGTNATGTVTFITEDGKYCKVRYNKGKAVVVKDCRTADLKKQSPVV